MSLSPKIRDACRRAMREADARKAREHVSSCPECAELARRERALGALLTERPPAPSALAAASFLEGIYERAVEHCEAGATAELLEASPPPAGAEQVCWQDVCCENVAPDSELARELERPPASPAPAAWSRVRAAVIEGASVSRRRKPVGWRIVLAGAAAAAVAALFTVSDGTRTQPTIVFTELGEAPDIPFAIVRYGVRD